MDMNLLADERGRLGEFDGIGRDAALQPSVATTETGGGLS
jgi:hypothetical protein